MTTPNSRASRKRSQKAKVGTAPIFREARDLIRRSYLFKLNALETLILEYDKAITLPWMSADYLKQSRVEAGISQEKLAQLSGISRLAIANYETAVSCPSVVNAEKLYLVLEELGSDMAGFALLDMGSLMKLLSMKLTQAHKREIEALTEESQRLQGEGRAIAEMEQRLKERIAQRASTKAEQAIA